MVAVLDSIGVVIGSVRGNTWEVCNFQIVSTRKMVKNVRPKLSRYSDVPSGVVSSCEFPTLPTQSTSVVHASCRSGSPKSTVCQAGHPSLSSQHVEFARCATLVAMQFVEQVPAGEP